MKMTLTENDLREMMLDRACFFETHHARDLYERETAFETKWGSGQLKETGFEGVHISYGNFSFANKNVRLWAESDIPVVEMHFTLTGFSEARHGNGMSYFEVAENQHNLLYIPHFEGSIEMGYPKESCHSLEIHLTEKYFNRLTQYSQHTLGALAKSIRQQTHGFLSKANLPVTPRMKGVLSEIMHCTKTGVMKRLFLEGKMLELLSLQMEQYEQGSISKGQVLRKDDIEKIHHARYLIEQDIVNPPSLALLSQQIGLNDFKLKKGFKEQFNTTVYGYLHSLRMDYAWEELLNGNKCVQEVSDETGYKNPHHFTAAFKKKFGVLPRDVKREKQA